MPRSLRNDIVDGVHHVMNRGIDHGTVFADDNDRTEFGERLADVHARFGVVTLAYCLMGTHFHLVLWCPDGGLSAAMQSIAAVFTRHVNDRRGRDGALFRGRFHSLLITDDGYLQAAVRYIHRNPLDLPGVAAPEEYRWSSHRTYLGYRHAPPWLDTHTVLGAWRGDRVAFGRWVSSELGTPVGTPDRVDVHSMIRLCEMVVAERCVGGQRRAGGLARTLALAWAQERSVDPAALMDAFGVETPHAMRTALWRARTRVAGSDELQAAVRCAVDMFDGRTASQLSSDPGCDQRAARAAS